VEAGRLERARSAPDSRGPSTLGRDLRVPFQSGADIDASSADESQTVTAEPSHSSWPHWLRKILLSRLDRESSPRVHHTAMGQIRATIFNSWFNILILFLVPAGFVINYTRGPSLITFLVNFLGILPLSLQAEYAIAELTLRIGENWGGLAYTSQSGTCFIDRIESFSYEPVTLFKSSHQSSC